MILDLTTLSRRWRDRNVPMACPSKPDCPGRPDRPLARFALAAEPLRCTDCGQVASAIHWRTEGLLRDGYFPRE